MSPLERWFDCVTGLLSRKTALLLVAQATLAVWATVWIQDRGLEITDESYYLLSAKHPDSIKAFVSPQHWILAPLWNISGSLQTFRAVGLAVLLFSSAVLSQGVIVGSRRLEVRLPSHPFVAVFSATSIGALLYATTINLSPSYNLLASAGCYSAMGFALLSGSSKIPLVSVTLSVLAGVCLTIEFLSKPSAGVCTLPLVIILAWTTSETLGRFCLLSLTVILAFLTTLVGIVLAQGSWSETSVALASGYRLFRIVQSEPLLTRLLRYFTEYVQFFGDMLAEFRVFIIGVALSLLRPGGLAFLATMLALVVTLIAGGYFQGGSSTGGEQYVMQIQAILVMLCAGIAASTSGFVFSPYRTAFVAALFLAPYTVAIGTGNAIFTQVIVTAAPWGALTIVLQGMAVSANSRLIASAMTVAIAVTAAAQIVTSVFRPAYHLGGSLSEQSISVEAGGFGTIRVDPATASFVRDVNSAARACDIRTGLPFFGIYSVPGLALLLDAMPLISPWISTREQAASIMEAMSDDEKHGSLIVVRRREVDGSWPIIPSDLATPGTDFILCGTAVYPFDDQHIDIWIRR